MTQNAKPHSPIEGVTPFQPRICINARVVQKTEIRKWDKPTGTGSVFSVDLRDESGIIRVTCFKAKCDQYHNFVKVGKVYEIR